MVAPLKIRQVYYIKATPDRVFRALSEPAGLTSWFLEEAAISSAKGGEYKFQWIGGYSECGKVLEMVKGKRLSLGWPGPGGKSTMTKVTFTLKKHCGLTALKVEHTGFGRSNAWLEMYSGTKAGWAYYLMNLKSVIENGKDLRHPEDNIMG